MKAVKQSELSKEVKKTKPKKDTVLLKANEAKKLPKTEVKKIGVSATRAKKIKHSYKVKDVENSIVMKLKDGDVVVEMYSDAAPQHVKRIKELVREGFYDGLKFHRVIEGFMAQTGCPLGTGTGGSGKKLKAEFSKTPHKRGIVSMARAMDINSADSQFFICFADCSWLDGQYTVWGEVTQGMELIDRIKKGAGSNGAVSDPDEIISIKVIADL